MIMGTCKACVISTSDLADNQPGAVEGYESPFKTYGGRRAFHGAIATVTCFEDAGPIRAYLAEPGHGRVLVADAGGSRRVAVLGDKMARLGLRNGWAGVIVNGAVRDCETLATLDVGVLALGSVPVRGGLHGQGERETDVTVAGIPFGAGKYVYVDADGILLCRGPLRVDSTGDGAECVLR